MFLEFGEFLEDCHRGGDVLLGGCEGEGKGYPEIAVGMSGEVVDVGLLGASDVVPLAKVVGSVDEHHGALCGHLVVGDVGNGVHGVAKGEGTGEDEAVDGLCRGGAAACGEGYAVVGVGGFEADDVSVLLLDVGMGVAWDGCLDDLGDERRPGLIGGAVGEDNL